MTLGNFSQGLPTCSADDLVKLMRMTDEPAVTRLTGALMLMLDIDWEIMRRCIASKPPALFATLFPRSRRRPPLCACGRAEPSPRD